jgi:NADPH2:quinone reductase
MKAVQLNSFAGLAGLKLVDIDRPNPSRNEVLIQVRAAGINFAELEIIGGRYPAPRPLPLTMGFEASGIVAAIGSGVTNLKVGDRITSIVSSGGYAEYATADASVAIPIPHGVTFAEANAITIQGLTAYTLLRFAARPQPDDSVLIQAAAGGVGLFLVQLAKSMGVKKVIALASSKEKLDLVKSLGADFPINYTEQNWVAQVEQATRGRGVEVVLEANSGEIGDKSFKLMAPFGRAVIYGAKNAHDSFPTEKLRQLILKNQSVTGFNFLSLQPEQIRESVPALLDLINKGQVKLFAKHTFGLADVRGAFEALSNRQTIGKVVLRP